MYTGNLLDLNNIITVKENPSDTVSQVAWSPDSNYFACSSWDKKVYIWNFSSRVPRAQTLQEHTSPVLDLSWSSGGTHVAYGGCDNQATLWDLNSNTATRVAQHQAPVKICRMVKVGQGNEVLCTGSWDKTVQFTDLRQKSPIAQVVMPGKIYYADFLNDMGVVTTLDKFMMFDMKNPGYIQSTTDSLYKGHIRDVCILGDCVGIALAHIQGMTSIQYTKQNISSNPHKNYSFKCHRVNNDMYSVNVVLAVPSRSERIATFSSNGEATIWNINGRTKCSSLPKAKMSITSAAFNASGEYLVYSEGYDWSMGVNKATKHAQIYVNKCK